MYTHVPEEAVHFVITLTLITTHLKGATQMLIAPCQALFELFFGPVLSMCVCVCVCVRACVRARACTCVCLYSHLRKGVYACVYLATQDAHCAI